MFDTLDIFQMAGGLAKHAAARQTVISRNVANADTPNYRAQDIAPFRASYTAADASSSMRATKAAHIGATSIPIDYQHFDATGSTSPNGNTVAVETEMMKATQVRHQHDMALAVYKSSMNILKASLGRR